MKDLTTGHPGKVLFSYILPLFGSIIFQQLYNVADSFVAGRYIGTAALAAVGNSYEITLIYIAMAMGCNIGASVITADFYGQKRYGNVRTCVHTALIFSAVMGLVLTLIGICISPWLLGLINTPAEVFADSELYLNIYLMGYVFLLIYNVATGIFSALGDSQTPFWFLAVSSVSNIFVDILFVKEFHMGVAGVAWATFLCQSLSGIAALVAILKKVHTLKHEGDSHLFSFPILWKILHVAIPSAFQQGFISVGNIIIQSVINSFGTAAMGGYAAAIKLNNMTITSITAISNGLSNYSAQNIGAGKKERVHSGSMWGWLLSGGFAVLFTAVYLIFSNQLIGLFITDGDAEATQIGVNFLRIVTPFYLVVATKLTFDGILRGAQQMAVFMISTSTDLILRVTLTWVFSGIWQVTGIWMSWPVGWIVGTIISVLLYRRWHKKYLLSKSPSPIVE